MTGSLSLYLTATFEITKKINSEISPEKGSIKKWYIFGRHKVLIFGIDIYFLGNIPFQAISYNQIDKK